MTNNTNDNAIRNLQIKHRGKYIRDNECAGRNEMQFLSVARGRF